LQHDSAQRLHISEKDHQIRLQQEALREFSEKFEVDPYSAKHVVDAYKARLHDIRPPLLDKIVEEEIFSAVRNSLKKYAWEEYTRNVQEE
jgi:DNA-binding protein Fis